MPARRTLLWLPHRANWYNPGYKTEPHVGAGIPLAYSGLPITHAYRHRLFFSFQAAGLELAAYQFHQHLTRPDMRQEDAAACSHKHCTQREKRGLSGRCCVASLGLAASKSTLSKLCQFCQSCCRVCSMRTAVQIEFLLQRFHLNGVLRCMCCITCFSPAQSGNQAGYSA